MANYVAKGRGKMTKITQEELIKIAQMSHVDLHQDEIETLTAQLQSVLTYAERVQEVSARVAEPSVKNINIFREDVVVQTDVEPILAQAPEREGNYFVVPPILDTK